MKMEEWDYGKRSEYEGGDVDGAENASLEREATSTEGFWIFERIGFEEDDEQSYKDKKSDQFTKT